jgi:membrane protease subunit HflC
VLGEHRETFDGADPNEAGLKFGVPWPILQTQRLDRRLQQFDLPPVEQLTHDPKGNTVDKILLVEAYVCWKITDKDGVDRFVRRIGTANRAREILAPEITGKLGAAIGKKRMDDFINIDTIDPLTGATRVDLTVESLRLELLDSLKNRCRNEYGIDLVDIRLRRFNHPGSVRDSIFARIKSERSKEAKRYQDDGEYAAENKLSEADETVRKALAKAKTEEAKIKSDADIEARNIRNKAYAQDKEFYNFLLTMESLQSIVGSEKSFLMLSTHRPMFELMFKQPLPSPKDKNK